jgi:hypothetical protein
LEHLLGSELLQLLVQAEVAPLFDLQSQGRVGGERLLPGSEDEVGEAQLLLNVATSFINLGLGEVARLTQGGLGEVAEVVQALVLQEHLLG